MTSLSKSDKSSNSSDDNRQLFPPKLSSNIVLINLSDQNVRIRQRGSLPGFYGCESGALIEDWLDECEKAANLNGWTKQEMLKNFAKHLHGGAKIFHQQELIGIQSFEEWKEAMIMKYKREDKSYYMRKFNELRQETRQPVQEFLALIDSYFVKAYGLAVVTARPLRSVKSLIKINILAKGLLPEIWAEIEQLVCPDDRIPPWGEIVKALKDTEWKLKLLKSKIRLPIKNPERFFKAYIASSAINQVVAGYGVFFNDTKIHDISAAVDEQDPQTCNVALIIAAIRAIEHAKQHGVNELMIYTNCTYLLNFTNEWAIKWLAKKWRKRNGKPVLNVNYWRGLLNALENIQVEWTKNDQTAYNQAYQLARAARFKVME